MPATTTVLALLLSAQAAAPAAPAEAPPTYMMVRCIKSTKGDEYVKVMRETTAKSMQVRADEGDINGWVFARAVIPSGADAECDFLLVNLHKGFPPARKPIDQYFEKANLKLTRAEWYAKLGAVSKLVRLEMWRGIAEVGKTEQGNFFRVDYLRVPAARRGEWRGLEGTLWRPAQEQRVRAGELGGWRADEIVLPAGSGHRYDARTVSVYPSWDAIGRASPDGDAVTKARLNRKLLEKAGQAQELVRSELYEVIEVVRPTTAIPHAGP